jgi:hypothetical protein
MHLQYNFPQDLPQSKLCSTQYNKDINRYKVKVGSTLEEWEQKGWIKKCHPYGWVHWYCDFCSGLRCEDDARQIRRWKSFVARFGKRKLSPRIRQTLQHWAYDPERPFGGSNIESAWLK